ncbi:MAG: DNA polymerase Y family protein, partial [Pseudomonadota bacterium]|nr:DNA polymerase Y family protein [Pseudomonadota bacterium]
MVLIGGPAHRRELVSVNTAAWKEGLRPGQRLAAAHALLSKFAVVEHDEKDVAHWQQFLAAWAYRFSSQVYAQWPNAIVLEAQGSFSILGRWPMFEARLREDLTALGFRHRIALAPTPRAARVLSRVQD